MYEADLATGCDYQNAALVQLREWWDALPESAVPVDCRKLGWLALHCHEISWTHQEQWMRVPLRFWRQLYGTLEANAVLLYSIRYGAAPRLRVVGLVPLMHRPDRNPPTAEILLKAEYWTRPGDLQCPAISTAPALIAPNLETAFSSERIRAQYMQEILLNVTREVGLCSRAQSLMVELARIGERTPAAIQSAEVILRRICCLQSELQSPEGQLNQAKMRFYVKLAIVGMPYHLDATVHNPTLELAQTALWLWTTALLNILCPSENHVLAAISEFELPIKISRLDRLDAALQSSILRSLTPVALPAFVFAPSGPASNLVRQGYVARSSTSIIAAAALAEQDMVSRAGVREMIKLAQISAGAEPQNQWRPATPTSTGVSVDPQIPICFFCVLIVPRNAVPSRADLLRQLFWFWEHDMLLPRPAETCNLSVFYGVRPPPKNGVQNPIQNGSCQNQNGSYQIQNGSYQNQTRQLFFGVQELMFANFAAMAEFAVQWAGRSKLTISTDNIERQIVPEWARIVAHLSPLLFAPSYCKMPVGLPISQLILNTEPQAGADADTDAAAIDEDKVAQLVEQRQCAAPQHVLVPTDFGDNITNRAFVWPEFGGWLASRIGSDITRIRNVVERDYNNKPLRYIKHALCEGMDEVFHDVMQQLGTPLFVALTTQASATRSKASAAERKNRRSQLRASCDPLPADRSLAFLPQYKILQARVSSSRDTLCAFFIELVAPSPILKSTATDIRAGSKGALKLNIGAQYTCGWIDFGGAGRGTNLLSLIMHVKPHMDERAAYQYLADWADQHGADPVPLADITSAKPAASADEFRRKLAEAKREVAQFWARSLPLSDPAAEWGRRYLLERRALVSMPRALLEDNPSIRFSAQEPCSEPPNSKKPALIFFTTQRSAVQRIYLSAPPDDANVDQSPPTKATDMKVAKMSRGCIRLNADQRDVVCLRESSNQQYMFIAEGPETGLSVALAMPDHSVYVALGVNNIEFFGSSFQSIDQTSTAVWCRENDASPPATSSRILAGLRSRFPRVIEWFPPEQYNDFNDIHQKHPGSEGSRIIAESFALLDARKRRI